MRKITAQDEINIAEEESEIRLSAGNGRMILEVNYPYEKMPVRTFRRAMGYRKFLKDLDMPVYVYVNKKRIVRLKGRHFWFYNPFRFLHWTIRNILSS